jgi:hypothetical protein
MIKRLIKISPVVFFVLFLYIYLPLNCIHQLRLIPQNDLTAWLISFYFAGSYTFCIYFTGAWGWFGKVTRYALPALLAILAVTTFPYDNSGIDASKLLALQSILFISASFVFTVFAVMALIGRRLSSPALELSFPLQGGNYVTAQGGSSWVINIHALNQSQRYALDILKLNSVGLRARGLYPADPKRYAIFGTEVLSPCDGVVAAIENGYIDLSPPEREHAQPAGNHIAIETAGATVYLAHLMKDSICVNVGEHVHKGQLLGRVGNSGNSTEPHLHIHAEERTYPGKFSENPGVPIKFNGRYLVRNDCINVPV